MTRLGEPLPHDLLDDIERLPGERLRELPLDRLRSTLRPAYDNVEPYRERFDAAGVGPDDCRSLRDLSRFALEGFLDHARHKREPYTWVQSRAGKRAG